MNSTNHFEPSITMQPVNDKLRIVVDTLEGDLNKSPSMHVILDYPTVSELNLAFDGFDELEVTPDNKFYIKGRVYLEIHRPSAEVERILISSPHVSVINHTSIKRHQINESTNFNQNRQTIFSKWQEQFADAVDDLHYYSTEKETVNNTEPTRHAQPVYRSPRKRRFRPNLAYLFTASLVVVAFVLAFYLSSQRGAAPTATQNTDVWALAAQQNADVDKVFTDMGIDRSKLTADLSCFTDE